MTKPSVHSTNHWYVQKFNVQDFVVPFRCWIEEEEGKEGMVGKNAITNTTTMDFIS